MRKLFYSILTAVSLFILTGCYDTIQEITINNDGTGKFSNTNDMSNIIPLMKNMGLAEQIEKEGGDKFDSTINLAALTDSIPGLTPEEKKLAAKGVLNVKMDMKAEQFITNVSFPFTKPGEMTTYSKLASKAMAEAMKDQMGDMPEGGDGEEEMSSPDDYYTYEFSNGELKRKVIKEKYATVASNKIFEKMQEAAAMGLSMKNTYIINLPRPAKEVEGKNAKLSEDKMKVTVTATLDEFLADASVLEFKVKY